MTMKSLLTTSLLSSAIALTISPLALAQMQPHFFPTMPTAPDYGSGAAAGAMNNSDFNTPESDGRPGVKAYKEGMIAYTRKDYAHAVHMLKVAASWAYKPAEYNLGVMYFEGQGVPVDRPLGAAWLVLAAERGDPRYIAARDVVITSLSDAQFAQTDELWSQLNQTYGDKVALRRAKAQWAFVKTNQTGTRVGGTVGDLHVGMTAGHGQFKTSMTSNGKIIPFKTSSWLNVLSGGSTDGSIAYRQFQLSDNPYDPVFLLKNRTGTVSVEPLQRAKPANNETKKHDPGTGGSPQPAQQQHSV